MLPDWVGLATAGDQQRYLFFEGLENYLGAPAQPYKQLHTGPGTV